jgi:predicted HTH domain antitoxin
MLSIFEAGAGIGRMARLYKMTFYLWRLELPRRRIQLNSRRAKERKGLMDMQ